MKSYYIKFLLVYLLAVFFLDSAFSQIVPFDSTNSNSVKLNSNFSDSSTFYNQLYNSSLFGDDYLIYRNIGSITDFKFSNEQDLLPGFRNFNFLSNLDSNDSLNLNSSHIGYLKGSKLEQVFIAGFRQRLFKYFILSADFRSINSPGFFINQLNKVLNYEIGVSYLSKDNSWFSSLEYKPSIINQQLNGGVKFDSLVSGIANNAGKSLEVNLSDASMKLRNKVLNGKLEYRSNSIDSSKNSYWFIKSDFTYKSVSYLYNSKTINTDYYYSVNYDSLLTDDSLFFFSASYALFPGLGFKTENSNIQVYNITSFDLNTYHYFRNTIKYNVFSTGVGAEISNGIVNSEIKAIYRASKEFESGVELKATSRIILGRGPFDYEINAEYKSVFPSPYYEAYNSNHFQWKNNFSNSEIVSSSFSILNRRGIFRIKTSWLNIRNYVFFNSTAMPVQKEDPFNVLQLKTNFKFRLYKKWFLYSDVSVQKTDDEKIYRMPFLYSYTALFHESLIFRKAMRLSFGTGCYFYSQFMANALMPATNQFYLQNDVNVGGFPYVDLFVNFRIKTVDFFLKIENSASGIVDAESFYAPHQPTPGRTLKVGINWTFNDNQLKR